ncbi:hypothetical protein CCAX7_34930 [Capsulimonas corticalis]|uniref:Uncharacterized protein n=1 Tax=Capsulimonas corticalis TaxID=2219043 RepID=A0A402CY79_9BACT|nr:hypothetical protein [Capsulimonas corticalis]BDI31442.1 hypothetical protein CCAX7_34930 [Capsulimonas corticalis]
MTDQQIGTVDPENAFVQTTAGASVTGQSVVTDHGVDKEVVSLHPVAGASSEAPASSGIPSARNQQSASHDSTAAQNTPRMSDRLQSVSDGSQP